MEATNHNKQLLKDNLILNSQNIDRFRIRGRCLTMTKNNGGNQHYIDVSEDQDIKAWISEQGFGHAIPDFQPNGRQKQVAAVDVTNNPEIHTWLNQQGLGHLIKSPSPEEPELPVHFPKLVTDDFNYGRRSRSMSIAIPSEYHDGHNYDRSSKMHTTDTIDGSNNRRRSESVTEFDPSQHLIRIKPNHRSSLTASLTKPQHQRFQSKKDSSSSSSSSDSSESGSENEIIHINTRDSLRKHERARHGDDEHVIQKQRVFVRYLQPPTPPADGPIIIKETPVKSSKRRKQAPIIIRQKCPSPPTPLPIIYREQAPPPSRPEPTTIIKKRVPAPPSPRHIIIEKIPPPPPKHPDIIIEKWLPPKRNKHRDVIIHQCEPPTIQSPNITIVESRSPCDKHNIRYINRIYDESPSTACPTSCHSVLNCTPACCMNPSTLICQPGKEMLIADYI
ncbi:hypothetical protein GJ496_006011 [Pomphorhynchus laevis]|nr:hypothetical protein GJ496_006011 [Pomphorhynchus laevis]